MIAKTLNPSIASQFQHFEGTLSQIQQQIKPISSENQNSDQSIKSKRQRLRRKKTIFRKSTWTLKQNSSYKRFLIENKNLFEIDKQSQKALQINVLISKYVKTRSSDQCRSHHQKMIKSHNNIMSIILYIQELEINRIKSFGKKETKMMVVSEQEIPEQIYQNRQILLVQVEHQFQWKNPEADELWWDGSEI